MLFSGQFEDLVYRPVVSADFINNDVKDPSNGYISLDNALFNSQTPDKFVYIVKPWDNLPKIAQEFGTTVSNIMSVNDLSTRTLKVWQALKITQLEGMIYVLDEQLTVSEFAHKYSLNLEELISLNYYPNESQILGTWEEVFIAISEEEAMENGLIEKPEPPKKINPSGTKKNPNASKNPTKSPKDSKNSSKPQKNYYLIKKTDSLVYKPVSKSSSGGTKAIWGAWRYNTAGKNFGFANGNCTAYVAAVRKDIWKPWQTSPFRGNAKQRYNNAANAWLNVGKKAKEWSIVVLGHGPGVNSYYGHVGIVKAVNADGTITVESMNGRGGKWVVTVDNYDVSQAKGYIYGK